MAVEVGALRALLSLDSSAFDRGADRARRSLGRMDQSFDRTSSRLSSFGRAFTAGAVAAGFTAFTAGVGRAVSSMAQLAAEADRAGVGVEDFQQWSFVAQQNRISIDAMVDGLKELSLRTDEFVVTGAGPAAEAFERLGLGAEELGRAIEDPTALMDVLIDRMRGLDRAAQIRVADEIFGGTGGEQLVRLIDLGSVGLQRLRQEARDSGAVLEESVIRRAEEIDRRFEQLRRRATTFFQGAVVGAVDFAAEVVNLRTELDDLFRSYDQARGLLGEGVANSLSPEDVAENSEAIGQLRQQYESMADSALASIPLLQNAAQQLRAWGMEDVAADLNRVSAEISDTAQGMRDGTVDAETFEARMTELTAEAQNAFAALNDVDRAEFSNVIGSINALIERLAAAAAVATNLRNTLPGASSGLVGSGRGGDPRNFGGSFLDWQLAGAGPNAPATSPRPSLAPNDPDFGVPNSSGGGGGGGIGAFRTLVRDTRAEIVQLQAEAQSLASVASSGQDVGDALEYARRRAELLYAAQEEGLELTPELRAQIDELALSYTRAGEEAANAAERLQLMEQYAERGADAMTDLFVGILDGSRGARDAVRALVAEIARIQFRRLVTTAAGSGGIFGTLATGLGRLLSFDGGGYTGSGPRSGGVDGRGGFHAILHPNETVVDHNRPGQVADRGPVHLVVSMDNNGNLQAFVDDRATKISGNVAIQVSQASAMQQRRNFSSVANEQSLRGVTS